MRSISVWNPWGVLPRGWADWDEEMEMANTEMDVYEEGDTVVVKLKAPGFKKDQLDISIESGMISIVGKSEEKIEEQNKGRKYYRKEINVKSFTRTATLPVPVTPDKAQAKFEDGVLVVTLPKSAEAKPKKIGIA